MNLTKEASQKLINLLNACKTAAIETLIVSKDTIRGIDENRTVVITTNVEVPDFQDHSICLNRLNTLLSRINLVKDEDFKIEMKEDNRNKEAISTLNIETDSVKVQYRAGSIEIFDKKIPKAVRDEHSFAVTLPVSKLPLITNAISSMSGATDILFTLKNDGMSIELVDQNLDTFTSKVSDEVTEIDGRPSFYSFKYNIKSIIPILKAAGSGQESVVLVFGKKGTLELTLNGYPFILMPKA